MLSSSIRSILEEIITNLLPESTAPPHHPPTDARNLKIIIFHYCGRQVKLMCSISIITWCSNYAWPETMVKLRAIANRSICSDNMKRLVRYYDRLRGAGVVFKQNLNIHLIFYQGRHCPFWMIQTNLEIPNEVGWDDASLSCISIILVSPVELEYPSQYFRIDWIIRWQFFLSISSSSPVHLSTP